MGVDIFMSINRVSFIVCKAGVPPTIIRSLFNKVGGLPPERINPYRR